MSDQSTPTKFSCIKAVGKIWRHCCCRYGFYPLIVAPFVTASFLMDVYCSLGCGFVTLDVGFQPTNEAWDKQKLEFGLFNVQSGVVSSHSQPLMNLVHPGCVGFDELFKQFFIQGDKTWVMSQIMGIISGCAGCVATVAAWLMVVTPIPVCFLWSGMLLPASLIAFLGSGAKFLFFDIEICRSELWLSDGDDTSPQIAQSCSLGMDAVLSIISSTLALACVLLVCLKAPKKRVLDSDKELQYTDVVTIHNLRTHSMEDSIDNAKSFDFESQVKSSHQKKSVYDLESITETAHSSDVGWPNNHHYDNPDAEVNTIKSFKNMIKTMRRGDPDSEKLRTAEKSIEYDDKNFNKKHFIPRPATPPMKRGPMTTEPQQSTPKPKKQSSLFSPGAPSDEEDFLFRSPYAKDNNSPHLNVTPKTRSATKKMKSSSKMKSVMETDEISSKSQKYDEDLIQQCVVDLRSSYTELDKLDKLAGQVSNNVYL